MSWYQTRVKQGLLIGEDKGFYAVYRGIPYAKAPVGNLRFCAPQEPESWQGVREAKHEPPVALQKELPEGSFYEKEFYREDTGLLKKSEDCLYLNIWTPAGEGDSLPVMFWIHGGAFRQGFGLEREFDGKAYCQRNVILVTIQYRLGVLGFLNHTWLEKGGGNLALQDQLAALKWVYENIKSFGGNPEKITVAGQSAGAVSVQALLCSEKSRGLIHQAILQSGGGYGQLARRCQTKKEALLCGEVFLKKCGITSKEELLNTEGEILLSLASELHFPCSLVWDGEILPLEGETAMYREDAPKVLCLLGSNKNDIRVTQEMLQKGIPSDLYVGNQEFAARYGGCFLYFFERALPGDGAGSFHSAELWYMFGTLTRCWRPFTEEDKQLSERMLDAWSSFIKMGSPGENWRVYQKEEPYIKIWH